MNEQAIIDSYILFKKDGYLKSFQEFKQLIATNPDALNYSYELFKKDGYTKSLNDYKILMGVGVQPNPSPNPNPTPNPNPPLNNDFPPCASKKGKVVKTPKGIDVIVYKTTVWDTPLVQLFAKSTRFMVLGGKHKGEKGNYKCLQNNKLFLELDSVKNAGLKKPESKIISTTLTPEDLKNGRIVKLGMKGDIVGKIQELLISNGHKEISKDGKVDNIFGGRTKKMVKAFQSANGLEDDGAVGPLTWAKLSDSSLTTKKSEYTGMGDDSPEFLQAQLDAQKSQLPVNHGKIEIDDGGNPFVFDGYKNGGTWVPQSEFLQSYNADGTKKLQENIIKNIVLKNLHSLL
jgi:hypothetical protein